MRMDRKAGNGEMMIRYKSDVERRLSLFSIIPMILACAEIAVEV